jgi:PTH1 family peptidyl-tRNA hydrolase
VSVFCIVGLGNPGQEYERSWHNVGFRVVDEIAARCGVSIRRRCYRALTVETMIGRAEVLLLKPQDYMNRSGESVAAACRELTIPIERVVVAFDDADLPLGRLRIRKGGGSGGHRGLASIIETTGSAEFVRVRLGIGRPASGDVDLATHVLSPIPPDREAAARELFTRAAEAIEHIVTDGVDAAMRQFNGAVEPSRPE